MTNIPTHIVYHVRDIGTPGETDTPRAVWTNVGVAWQHSDTKDLNIVLETLPLNGRLVVRTAVQESNQTQTPEDMGQ
jgi:hypothetical protein